MNTSPSKNSSGGVSFYGLLFITFLVLKLTGVITWSWWWVTAPLWGTVVLVVAITIFLTMLGRRRGGMR